MMVEEHSRLDREGRSFMERTFPEDLSEAYTRAFGKKPHHRMKPETIKRRLEEHDTGSGGAGMR